MHMHTRKPRMHCPGHSFASREVWSMVVLGKLFTAVTGFIAVDTASRLVQPHCKAGLQWTLSLIHAIPVYAIPATYTGCKTFLRERSASSVCCRNCVFIFALIRLSVHCFSKHIFAPFCANDLGVKHVRCSWHLATSRAICR